MAKNQISQIGTITAITDEAITVNICTPEACGSCKAKDVCGAGNAGRDIMIPNDGEKYAVGESVKVSISQSMGMKAVAVAYMLPVIVVVAAMVVMRFFGVDELVTGCSALGILILYYIGVYFFRDKLSKEITFQIEK